MKTKATNRVDLMFRAFSDRTRLRILNLLRSGETCVCDIVEILEAPQPTVSRHLAYLRRTGLVKARRDGAWMHYSLANPRDPFHRKLLECLDCCFNDVPQLARDHKKLNRKNSRGCCG